MSYSHFSWVAVRANQELVRWHSAGWSGLMAHHRWVRSMYGRSACPRNGLDDVLLPGLELRYPSAVQPVASRYTDSHVCMGGKKCPCTGENTYLRAKSFSSQSEGTLTRDWTRTWRITSSGWAWSQRMCSSTKYDFHYITKLLEVTEARTKENKRQASFGPLKQRKHVILTATSWYIKKRAKLSL
jgi:hypothetical protein